MKVLITGGAGHIGSVLVHHLLSERHTVTVYDKLIYGGEALLPFWHDPRFNLVVGDILDFHVLKDAMSGHDAVVHLAAIVGESACGVVPHAAWETNKDGAIMAHQAAGEAGIKRFVFISTCSNYGVSAPNVLVNEDAALLPQSEYASAKVGAEEEILGSSIPMESIVLRLGTMCGLSGRMRFDLMISEMARAVVLNEEFEIYTPGAWRPFLHVADAAEAIGFTLMNEIFEHEVYNVVGENMTKETIWEMARQLAPNAKIKLTDKEPDRRDYRVDGSRFVREIRFAPQRTVRIAFVDVMSAIRERVFVDPKWVGHSAVPASILREKT